MIHSFTLNIHLEIRQLVPHLLLTFQNITNNLSFSSLLVVNFELIEQNINSIFVNKCDKI